jgi:hypothetical protein
MTDPICQRLLLLKLEVKEKNQQRKFNKDRVEKTMKILERLT